MKYIPHPLAWLSLLVPCLVFWGMFDVRILDPAEYAWLLRGDLGRSFISWHLFRYDAWTLPLANTDLLNFPHGVSLVFTDSNPLAAILLKPLSPLLPPYAQFIGPWYLLCLVLNYHAITRLLGLFVVDRILVALLALLFILYPPFFMRIVHANLLAHFLWIYALYFFLADWRYRQSLAGLSLLSVAAAGIHFYFAPVIVALALARAGLAVRAGAGWRRPLQDLAVIQGLPLLAIIALLGYFENYAGAAEGYGRFSMNLNAFWNSMGLSWFFDGLPTRPKQYEGFQYLGLGWMLTLVAGLALARRRDLGAREAVLLALAAGLTLFALSHRVYWGETLVLSVPLPETLHAALSVFRASGRFAWFAAFVVFLLAARGLHRAPTRLAYPLVAGAIMVQVLDLTPLREEFVRDYTADNQYTVPEIQTFMTVVGDRPAFISVLHEAEPWLFNLGLEAAPRGVPVANMPLARAHRDQRQWLAEQRQALRTGNVVPDGVYVTVNRPREAVGLDSFRVAGRCVSVAAGSALAPVLARAYPPIPQTESLSAVLESCTADCALALAIQDEGTRHLPDAARDRLKRMGADIGAVGYRQSYAALIKDGRLVAERHGDSRVAVAGRFGGRSIRVESAGYGAGSDAAIQIDGRERAPGGRGLNVVRLRKDGRMTRHAFDTHTGLGDLCAKPAP